MDFLDNNKDLPTHGMKRKTKMENQKRFSGGFVNLQIKLKKNSSSSQLQDSSLETKESSQSQRKQPIPSFKACPEAQIPTALFQSPPSLRKQTLAQKNNPPPSQCSFFLAFNEPKLSPETNLLCSPPPKTCSLLPLTLAPPFF